jgi:hypothetical protein
MPSVIFLASTALPLSIAGIISFSRVHLELVLDHLEVGCHLGAPASVVEMSLLLWQQREKTGGFKIAGFVWMHCVDWGLALALSPCFRRFDHVQIASIMHPETCFTMASPRSLKRREKDGLAWLLQPALLCS